MKNENPVLPPEEKNPLKMGEIIIRTPQIILRILNK